MGGRTAVGFSLLNPGRCKAIAFCGTTGGAIDDDVRDLQDAYRQTEMGQLPLGQEVRLAADEGARRRPRVPLPLDRPPQPARAPRTSSPPSPATRAAAPSASPNPACAILFLVGDHDAVTPPNIIEGCHNAVPGSEFVLIKDSGHCTYFEQPEQFNEAVLHFLKSTL